MVIDRLESRLLLSASFAVPLKRGVPQMPEEPALGAEAVASVSRGGTLTILGTDDADEISIVRGSKGKYYSVVANGEGLVSFKSTAVRQIVVALGAGGDDLALWDLNTPATVLAGVGDDLVVGTGGRDVIFGADGNDSIEGAGGNDSLVGMDGNDTLDGGAGYDQLTGGAGDDTWVVSANADAKTDTFEYVDAHGQAVVVDDVPLDALSAKVVTQDGQRMLRVIQTLPCNAYQVDWGEPRLASTTPPGDDSLPGAAYDVSVRASLPLDAAVRYRTSTYRHYYDLSALGAGHYVFAFSDPISGASKSVAFTL